MSWEQIDPQLTRRNIVVSGINLMALKDRNFQIGENVVLKMTGACHPSKDEGTVLWEHKQTCPSSWYSFFHYAMLRMYMRWCPKDHK